MTHDVDAWLKMFELGEQQTISRRTAFIIYCRCVCDPPLTYEEIGKFLFIRKERVRQLTFRAQRRMHEAWVVMTKNKPIPERRELRHGRWLSDADFEPAPLAQYDKGGKGGEDVS